MKSKLILVTGGAGYIGSHAVLLLRERGYDVIIIDNLKRGNQQIVVDILNVPLVKSNVGSSEELIQILSGQHPATQGRLVDAVLHFAAFAYVGESTINPALYYRNNTTETLDLLIAMKHEAERRNKSLPIVFSSTCATYGVPDVIPINEKAKQQPINPYGKSKLMIENILDDFWKAYEQPCMIFRYFNAAGADPKGRIGELHVPETHLIPCAFHALAHNAPPLTIYGSDYETIDGTCIRDYIHVNDLANAHILGLEMLLESPGHYIYNLGNGDGFSVMQVLAEIAKVAGRTVPYRLGARRGGDPAVLVACADLAKKELGWIPQFSELNQIISHAWNWHLKSVACDNGN
jgi:UDP-glucose 4-epimerase